MWPWVLMNQTWSSTIKRNDQKHSIILWRCFWLFGFIVEYHLTPSSLATSIIRTFNTPRHQCSREKIRYLLGVSMGLAADFESCAIIRNVGRQHDALMWWPDAKSTGVASNESLLSKLPSAAFDNAVVGSFCRTTRGNPHRFVEKRGPIHIID